MTPHALGSPRPLHTVFEPASDHGVKDASALPPTLGFEHDVYAYEPSPGLGLADPGAIPARAYGHVPGTALGAWRTGFGFDAVPDTPGGPALQESPAARRQREALAHVARQASAGRNPDGRCYHHVWRFLTWIGGYGQVLARGIPASHSRYARQFADYVNRNPAAFGLRRLPLDNPYEAPAGAIVVVRPGAPGTGHPYAGDIAVADGKGRFYNGGEMSYGGPGNFPPGNRHVLGIYVPV